MTYRRIHGKVNVLLCFRAKIVACHQSGSQAASSLPQPRLFCDGGPDLFTTMYYSTTTITTNRMAYDM